MQNPTQLPEPELEQCPRCGWWCHREDLTATRLCALCRTGITDADREALGQPPLPPAEQSTNHQPEPGGCPAEPPAGDPRWAARAIVAVAAFQPDLERVGVAHLLSMWRHADKLTRDQAFAVTAYFASGGGRR